MRARLHPDGARNSSRLLIVATLLATLVACGDGGSAALVDSLPPEATQSSTSVVSSTTVATTITTIATPTTAAVSTTVLVTAPPVDRSEPPEVDAAAYVVYDVGSQRWLAESEADTVRPVGSVMKLLTAYVVMQAGDPSHVATVPAMDLNSSESSIGLYEGEQLPRDLLLRAMLIVSANDAARTLAVDVGGTEDAFVMRMNEAAQALGLANTVAKNPVGLDAPGAGSSARDMVVLATILMDDPTFRATVARGDARLHGMVFPATNDLLTTYDGATGVKTGHTTEAGYCVVASATRDGRSVIVAVLGAPTEKAWVADATALLDWAFIQ